MRHAALFLAVLSLGIAAAARTDTRAYATRVHAPTATRRAPPILLFTTRSPLALSSFEKGMSFLANEKLDKALASWRLAIKYDPNFAMAHAFLCFASTDPTEEQVERHKAKMLAAHANPGEQLAIKWIVSIREDKYLAGIAAINDLLAMYPRDKRLLFLAGNWLASQNDYERSQSVLERALELDSNYAAALNVIAYTYAATGKYQRAFAAMERYVILLPKEPNPNHSYGEILRKAGNFKGALDHYRAALNVDQTFYSAQLGIADTYSLMGEEETARREYLKAIHMASSESERIDFEIQAAITYIREKKYGKATSALDAVAQHARNSHVPRAEAQAYRLMAMFEHDDSTAFKRLEQADQVLASATDVSIADLDRERATIMATRAVRAAMVGDTDLSQTELGRLGTLSDRSRNLAIQHVFQAAIGSVLVVNKHYAEAIPHLEEDMGNPISMERLVNAYNQTGAADKAHVLEMELASINEPSIEQALVVPDLRLRLGANKQKRHFWQIDRRLISR